MGASGSVVSGGDHTIEMNIVDERRNNGNASMHRHSSQPANTLFSTFKPRQKDNTVRNTNLRSSGSFDLLPPPTGAPTDAVGIVRKEYDTLKLAKEQEIQALQRKEQKLDMENTRLRAELHALNKQCQKLRAERDSAKESSYLATERATALEQDREKIQRQFKIFRETKEAEIQGLLQAKRHLESTLHRLQAQGMATMDDHTFSSDEIPQTIHTNASLEDQPNWWAAPESEATSMFGSYAQLQTGSQVGFSESVADVQETKKSNRSEEPNLQAAAFPLRNDTWLSSSMSLSSLLETNASSYTFDNAILRCYLSSTPDLLHDVEMLRSSPYLNRLKLASEKEGYFLSIIHFTNLQDYNNLAEKNDCFPHRNIIAQAISRASVFISFIGSSLGTYTELEIEEAHFKASGSKSVLFCIKDNASESSKSSKFLIEKLNSSSNKKLLHYVTQEQGCDAGLKEIIKAVRLEFGVRLESESTGVNEVKCLDELMTDPHMERVQNEIASMTSNRNQIQPVGFEKCYDRFDEVITSPGPVPPLLVSGSRSSGKTLLLSSWTAKLRNSRPDVIVLQHFVTNPNSIDAQPVILLRRILSQLCNHFPHGSHPPVHSCSTYDVNRLRQTLPRLIEQLFSRRNKRILLVIDSIDRVKDVQRYFGWLLDPLPVGVRVVISVDVDSCPEEWRQFPTLHLEPLSLHAVKLLLKEHARKRCVEVSGAWERDVASHCRTATTCHPLYVTLLSAVVCSVSDGRAADSLLHLCLKKQDSREIYTILLRDIESMCPNKEAKQRFKSVLQFLICSRSGLSETEIMTLLPDMTWYEWTDLFSKLTNLCIVKEQAGVVIPHNSEVSDFLFAKYVGNEILERRSRQRMIAIVMKNHHQQVTPRNTELLLWMLRKDEERSMLLEVLKSPQVLDILYSSGRNSELAKLWNFLNEDKVAISKYYLDELKKFEANSSNSDSATAEVARIYQSLGRFFKDMNLTEEAVSSLQKSLEIQERILDPDDPAVADTLHYLASVYAQWGKLETAESLYKQALELIESVVTHDHLRIAQELGALSRIARKSGRQKEFERLHRRVVAIQSKSTNMASTRMERLRKRALRLEELTLDDDSIEMANALNDLGVLYHLQNNLENAKSFFLRSLKMREKLVGLHHIDAAQSFHNLASVYNQKKAYKKALECMNKALEIRRSHSANDAVIANTLKHLAVLYKKSKDFVRASEIYEQLLQIAIDSSGEYSDITANAMSNLAIAKCQNERFDEALPLYKKALKIYQDLFGPESSQVSQTLKNIAILLYQKGNFEEAAMVYKESMAGKYTSPKASDAW